MLLSAEVREPPLASVLAVVTGSPEERRRALWSWLRPSLASELAPLPDDALASVLVHLVGAFTPAHKGAADLAQAPGGLEFQPAIFGVASRLGIAPADVLSMPWGQFIDSVQWCAKAREEDLLDAATAARVSQASADDWKKFTRALRGASQGETIPEAERARYDAQAEHVRRQVEHFKTTGRTDYGNVGEA